MSDELTLSTITKADFNMFLTALHDYYQELNPAFVPENDWAKSLLMLLEKGNYYMQWIIIAKQKVGFTIYSLRKHFLYSRLIGVIQEFCILPPFRRTGIGKVAALRVVEELFNLGAYKIQLEVLSNNDVAFEFWKNLGFVEVSRRLVLEKRV